VHPAALQNLQSVNLHQDSPATRPKAIRGIKVIKAAAIIPAARGDPHQLQAVHPVSRTARPAVLGDPHRLQAVHPVSRIVPRAVRGGLHRLQAVHPVNRTVRPEVLVDPLRPLLQANRTARQAFLSVPAVVDRVPAAMRTPRTVHRHTLRAIHKVNKIQVPRKADGLIKQSRIPDLPVIQQADCPVMLMNTHRKIRSTVTTRPTQTITVDHELF
jgi:hypothetical protein